MVGDENSYLDCASIWNGQVVLAMAKFSIIGVECIVSEPGKGGSVVVCKTSD